MKKSVCFSALLFAAICFALSTPLANAQAVFGSINGTVTDPQGAAVVGATVTVTDVAKGTTDTATTNGSGNYSVTHLIPDSYSVKIEASGFKAAEQKDVHVSADNVARVDAQMQLGATTEAVEVTAAAPQLKTDRADVSTEFNTRAVQDLPVLNRNFTNFELLTPGTQKLGWSHAATENPQGGGQIFVNGQHFSGTGFELDGTDNQDPILGIIVVNPNLDAVTEAKMSTADFDAEFGKAIAGLVTIQTKSGSNELHGSGFYYRRTDATAAKDPFTNWDAGPTWKASPIAPSRWQQFGGSLGGPIIKNKLFFFGDFQGTRQKAGLTQLVTVPTLQMEQSCNPATNGTSSTPGFCNLSEFLSPAAKGPINGQIYDPATGPGDGTGRAAFAGNLIPIARLENPDGSPSPAATFLALFPAPNTTGDTNGTEHNFIGAGAGPYSQNAFDTRIDFNAAPSVQVFGRFSLDYFSLSGKGVLGALGGVGFGPGGLAGSSVVHNYSLASGVTKTFSSTLLADFRFGYFKYNPKTNKPDAGSTPMTAAGIPNANLGDNFTSGLGEFDFNGKNDGTVPVFGDGLGVARCNCPLIENEQQFQWVTNWTKIHGNHQFKFGADVRYAENLRVPSDSNRTGVYNFTDANSALVTNVNTQASTGGVAFASFLLGDARSVNRFVSTSTNAAERQHRMFYYGEDSWRATSKLTVNYGLRWEVYFPEYVNGAQHGGFANIVQGVDRVAGVNGIGLNGNIGNDWHAFAPRIGFAYQLREKTVVRMGYGRSYDMGVFGSNFGHAVTQNLPVLAAQLSQNPNQFIPAFALAQGPPPFSPPPVPANGLYPLAGPQCTFGNTTDAQGNVVAPFCVQPHIRPTTQRLPYVDTWNAAIQHQLTNTMTLEVTYLGNKGTHGFVGDGPTYNVNQPFMGTGPQYTRRPFWNAFTYSNFADPSNVNGSAPGVLQCCFNDQNNYLGNDASSTYESLTVKLDKRFSEGLQFMTFYNLDRSYHYDSNYYVDNKRVAYGPDDNVRDNQWITNLVYDLPFGRGQKFAGGIGRAGDLIIGGWRISGTMNWSSGLPWTPTLSGTVCNADQDTGVCRPSKGSGSFHYGAGSFNKAGHFVQFFTPLVDPLGNSLLVGGGSAGGWADPGTLHIGNAGYDSLWGPRFFGADAALSKSFTVTERLKLTFRMDAYNLFNHPVLGFNQNQGGSGTCVDCGGNGEVKDIESDASPGSPNGMRQLSFGLRLDF